MNNGEQNRSTSDAVTAFLPLQTTASLNEPEIYSKLVTEAVQRSGQSLTIVFYQTGSLDISSLLSPQEDPSHWNLLQRFLGVVYGTAGREGAKLGRMVLDIRIFIQGLTKFSLSSRSYDHVLHLPTADEVLQPLLSEPEFAGVTRTSFKSALGQLSQSLDNQDTFVPKSRDKHQVAALGGTFDHLHGGHKILLTMAACITAKRLIVGLTTDEMLKSKSHADYLESFDERSAHLHSFLVDLDHSLEYQVVALKDVYGPTASDRDISALVVSRESAAGGQAIDAIRETKGLPKLETYVIDVVSGNHLLPTEDESGKTATLLDSTETSDRVKEMKLGSTYIRKWLAEKDEHNRKAKSEPAVQANQSRQGSHDKSAKRTALSGGQIARSKQGLSATRTAYEASSQRIRWTYSEDGLRDLRKSLNGSAVQHCQENWQLEAALHKENQASEAKIPAQYPSWEDEVMLIMFYAASITTIIMGGGLSAGRPLPNTIEGVAVSFLKRFYTRTSVLEWHPKVIMPVCLFLAGKVCNYVFDIDNYVASFDKLKREDILGIEYLVLQTLRFDVYIPRMQDALHGWFLQLQDANPASLSRVESAYHSAQNHLRRSRLSDVEFLFTPSQIAAACFRLADESIFNVALQKILTPAGGDVDKSDSNTAGSSQASDLLAHRELVDILQAIQVKIEAVPADGAFDKKQVKAIDKIVRLAQDPARNKTSELYRKQERDLETRRAEKRARQLKRARKDMDDRDAFFGETIGVDADQRDGRSKQVMDSSAGPTRNGFDDSSMELDSSDSD